MLQVGWLTRLLFSEVISSLDEFRLALTALPWTLDDDNRLIRIVNTVSHDRGISGFLLPLPLLLTAVAATSSCGQHSESQVVARYAALCLLNKAIAVVLPLIDFNSGFMSALESQLVGPNLLGGDGLTLQEAAFYRKLPFGRTVAACASGSGEGSVSIYRELKSLVLTQVKRSHWASVLSETTVPTRFVQEI